MPSQSSYDAIVVGSGPNGLAAAVTLARAGRSVLVLEAEATPGGGARSEELTLPGFIHDTCSAIHPLGVGSPFFQSVPLEQHGLEWIFPPSELAHPFDDGTAVLLERTVKATCEHLGRDAVAYRRIMQPLVEAADGLLPQLLGPLRPPRHPVSFTRFGMLALWPASLLANTLFKSFRTRGLWAGVAAHSFLPLEYPFTSSFALVLALLGHVVGWPLPRGGSGKITEALISYLKTLGGEVETGHRVRDVDELPPSRAVLFDLSPRQLVRIAGHHLPDPYTRKLTAYRYGPGVFKMDFALSGPIPWKAPECKRAATVHMGATLDEIAVSERAAWKGEHCERPYVLTAQQSLFDSTRAPEGKHTAWAYCHVPNGSTVDMSGQIEAQLERFAPGFRDVVLARHSTTPAQFESHNENFIGGDIGGGAADIRQLFTRPVARIVPYSTPNPRLYLCSASTPPGGGVHGMCGYHAARAALRGVLRD